MMKEIAKAYADYDQNGANAPPVLKAEKKFEQVYKQVSELNKDLAFELDRIVGELVRAYEMQGFEAGYKSAGKGDVTT